jgi:arginine decarboxylase
MEKLTIYIINYHDFPDFKEWKSKCKLDTIDFKFYSHVWPGEGDMPTDSPEPYIDILPHSLLVCHYNNPAKDSENILPFLDTIPKDSQVILFSGEWIDSVEMDEKDEQSLEESLPGRWRIINEEDLEDEMLSFLEKWHIQSSSFDFEKIPWEIFSTTLLSSQKSMGKHKFSKVKDIEKDILGNTSLTLTQKRTKFWHRLHHCETIEDCKVMLSKLWQWEKAFFSDNLDQLFQELDDAVVNNDLKVFKHKSEKWREYIVTSSSLQKDTYETSTSKKPEFTILIVDDSQVFIKKAISALKQRIEDCQDYDITIDSVLPEFEIKEQTLLKIEENGKIQIIIMDWDINNSTTFDKAKKAETGDKLIQEIKQKRPEINCFMVTGHDVASILKETDIHYRIFSKGDYLHDDSVFDDLFAAIIRNIELRSRTPFFQALKAYSKRRVSVFHAMPISSGRSLVNSSWASDFYHFYGENYFLAETSNTLDPLDSLLDPHGSLKDAIDLASETFGETDHTYFVTNGTSTSNKIVEQALLKPGDKVLIDRNCHKSHHYGLILCDARPIYLKAEPLSFKGEFTGICKGIATQEILSRLENNPDAKMLVITNTTFDGYMHHPYTIIKAVREKLEEIYQKDMNDEEKINAKVNEFIFLFDEAWFGFGFLHPHYRKYTAAYAAQRLRKEGNDIRIYATQSTHKTLCAFRQGSMIHCWDFMFKKVEQNFHESIYTHITTSPNYGILASLDVGRMQANLEGYHLVNNMLIFSSNIRDVFKARTELHSLFNLLDTNDMGISDSNFELDETRLTFYLNPKTGITGNECKRILLDDYDIQHNKTTFNTVLLMCNIGVNETVASHVVTALSGLANKLRKKRPYKRDKVIKDTLFKADNPVEFFENKNNIRDYFFRTGIAPKEEPETKSLKEIQEILKVKQVVSVNFVTPYPPGFPILVPGQIVTPEVIEFLIHLDLKEIHGMLPGKILQIWTMP